MSIFVQSLLAGAVTVLLLAVSYFAIRDAINPITTKE
jgi:hypothetical protein